MWVTVLGLRRPKKFDVVREKLLGVTRDKTSIEFGEHGEITVRSTNVAPSAAEATRLALESLADLMMQAGLTLRPHTIHTFPFGPEPVPTLAGTAEIAGILGVSKARVSQLIRSADFPAPVAKLAMGQVYLESVIWDYQRRRADHGREVATPPSSESTFPHRPDRSAGAEESGR